MPNPLADSFAAACLVRPEIRTTMGTVQYRLVNIPNMNAKQRREMRRWEKKYIPQMMERAMRREEDEANRLLSAVAGLGADTKGQVR